jgi:tRNA dimethylallyltransferase
LAADEPSLTPVITGPTAAGKSTVALWLAERFSASIIVADSRQVYRRFDIGTAKPTIAERSVAPHRGIDVVEPTERYSAAAWASAAEEWISESIAMGRVPLVVGGTGFYLRALFEPLFDEPPLEAARRRALEDVLAPWSLEKLQRWCGTLDPDRAHLGRTQLLRAVEVALLSGQRLSELHRAHARPARRTARYLVVDPGPALAQRITRRLDVMLDGGWLEEVSALARVVPDDAPAWKATGYESLRDLVRGRIDRGAARERILIATRQYAKRQRTWLRNQLAARHVTRLDPTDPNWMGTAERWLREGGERPA